MSSLRELQTRFVATLFEELPDSDATWIRIAAPRRGEPDWPEAGTRLAIYRNNLHEGFIKALSLEFPVIERLVGSDYFRQLAREFLKAHPSRAGDLHEVGAPFPEYLRARFKGTEYAYLPEVADLEWAYQQSAIAADAPDFDPAALSNVAPEDYGHLRFALRPACRLVRSRYPILKIWQANQSDAGDEAIIDLGSGAEHVITRRLRDGVELRSIAVALHALLAAFSQGRTLAEGWAEARQFEPEFDLGAALRESIRLGFLTTLLPVNSEPHEGSPS